MRVERGGALHMNLIRYTESSSDQAMQTIA